MWDEKGIEEMKSVLLIGLGRFGRHMAQKLHDLHHEVLAVDKDEERVNNALPFVTNAQIGDGTNEQFIASLGVRNFDLCVVGIGDNFQSSLETTALLKEYGAPFCGGPCYPGRPCQVPAAQRRRRRDLSGKADRQLGGSAVYRRSCV